MDNINRLNDALIKYVFARPESKPLTLSLINSFFDFEGTQEISDFEFRDRELGSDSDIGKKSQLDVLGECSDGTVVNIEVQVSRLKTMGKRSLFYWSKLYQQLLHGENYGKLSRTVCIDILNFNLFEQSETSDYHNCFYVTNRRYPTHKLTEDLEIHFVELPKFNVAAKNFKAVRRLDKWLKYFSKKTSEEERREIAVTDSAIAEAMEAEQRFFKNPKLITAYDIAEKQQRDQWARDEYLLDEGESRGRAEGLEQGITQGVTESIRKIMAKLNYSAKEAMDFLDIPESEQSKYAALI